MTVWGDHDRIEKIYRELREIHKSEKLIERLLGHMGTKPLDVTRSRPLGPLDDDVELNRGDPGDGDQEEGR